MFFFLAAGGGAADRFGGVRGASGDHTDHRHGHQPGEEPGRRRPIQPAQNLEATRKIHAPLVKRIAHSVDIVTIGILI